MLVLLYMATLFMFQIHEPAQAAFVQETFTPKHYKAINSLLEIENQTALVLAGGFAGMILGKFGLHVVLLFNALTYLIAFLMLSGIDYVFTLGNQAEKSPRRSWVEQFYQSWVYIRERRGFMIFGVCADFRWRRFCGRLG